MAAAIWTAIGSLGAVGIAGLTGWLTARASAKGAERAAHVSSMSDIERDAGTRATQYFKDALADSRAEYDDEREKATALRVENATLTEKLAACRETCRALERRLGL